MEAGAPSTRIVKFPSGEDLTVEDASSGRFVLAAGPEPDTIFALDNDSADELLDRWAQERAVGADVARARATAEALPADPSADEDEAAERARVEDTNRRLEELSAQLGIPMGAPEFIVKAHEEGILDSAILYQQPYYLTPVLGLSTSCTDLRRYLPTGALSARTYGYNVVFLYDQPNYGPTLTRRTPMITLVGTAVTALSPRPILSVLFN